MAFAAPAWFVICICGCVALSIFLRTTHVEDTVHSHIGWSDAQTPGLEVPHWQLPSLASLRHFVQELFRSVALAFHETLHTKLLLDLWALVRFPYAVVPY